MASAGNTPTSGSASKPDGLPPIPRPVSSSSSPYLPGGGGGGGAGGEHPKPSTQNVRTQAGTSRLKSPARQSSYSHPPPEPRAEEDKVRRKYASSLPDRYYERERRLSSPFDLHSFLINNPPAQPDHPPPFTNKHLWGGRGSLERDLLGSAAPTPPSAQSISSNRHSSYHPTMSLVDEAATAAADAVVHKLNKIILSRPPSPVMIPRASNCVGMETTPRAMSGGRCCCDGTRTFPRAAVASGQANAPCHSCAHAQPTCVSAGSGLRVGGTRTESHVFKKFLNLKLNPYPCPLFP